MGAYGTRHIMSDEPVAEHRGVHDVQNDASVATSVVVSVAAIVGVEPTALPPLQRSIDTDALEDVFASGREGAGDVTVRFSYAGCRVTVESDGSIRISELAHTT